MHVNGKKKDNRTIQTAICFVLLSIAKLNAFYSLLSIDAIHHPYETNFYVIFLIYSLLVIVVLIAVIVRLVEQETADFLYKYIIIAIVSVGICMIWDVTFWNGVACIMGKNLVNQIWKI